MNLQAAKAVYEHFHAVDEKKKCDILLPLQSNCSDRHCMRGELIWKVYR